MNTTIVLKMSAEPGQGSALVAAFEEILPATRAYPGCLGVSVHQGVTDPDDLLLIEHWASTEEYTAYNKWRMESGTLGGVMSVATGLPETSIYNDNT